MAKPTHEQRMRKRAKERRNAEKAEQFRARIAQEAKARGMSVKNYNFVRLVEALMR